METKTYYANVGQKRIGLILGIVLNMIGLGLLCFTILKGRFDTLPEQLTALILCGCLCLIGGYSVFDYWRTVQRKKPTFVIDADGIEITVPLLAKRRVPWSEIETTYLRTGTPSYFVRLRTLCFKVRNPQQIIGMMQTQSQRYVLQANVDLHETPVLVSNISLDAPIEDVQMEVENRLYERRKAQEANAAERLPDVPEVPQRLSLGNRWVARDA